MKDYASGILAGLVVLYERPFKIDEGYEVFTCDEVSRVMDLIADTAPDLLLIDIRLDGYSGLDLLQDTKTSYPALPVILCTGYPAYKYDMKSVAADDYVVKSSNLRELKEKIGKILYGGSRGFLKDRFRQNT